jgi:hypothetical protein
MEFIPAQEVKKKLRQIGPLKGFKVVFLKKSGEVRTIVGSMSIPSNPQEDFKSAVPLIEEESGQYRSFSLDSVIELAVV